MNKICNDDEGYCILKDEHYRGDPGSVVENEISYNISVRRQLN